MGTPWTPSGRASEGGIPFPRPILVGEGLCRARGHETVVGRDLPGLLIRGLAVYSAAAVALVSFVVLSGDDARERAIIQMALGLLLLWVVVGGSLQLRFRDPIRDLVRRLPGGWKAKFVLLATLLALAEEAVTTTMTNLAPLFGSEIGEAYITASANYLHVVLFHSVVLFVPMFVAWALLLSRYAFPPKVVFLLFGLVGTLAEASIEVTSLVAGFWFFVYGLMVYLPAHAVPEEREARDPTPRHYLLAVLLPFLFALPVAGVVSVVRMWLGIPLFTD